MFSAKDLFFVPQGGYTIAKSLRFRSSASAYLNRTPASAGSLTTWTWSGWVKRGALGSSAFILSVDRAAATEGAGIYFTPSDTLQMYAWNGTAYIYNYITTQVFRDPSSWYHLVFVLDTSNATSTDRVRIYVNGVRITAFGTSSAPTLGASGYVNATQIHAIGRSNYSTSLYFDGYLSEVNFIDGQALTPSDFGQTDTATGVWMPKAYTGSYGTNGFYLKFTDVGSTSGSNTGYGKDFAGTNYWTTNNFGTTSTATTYDSMVDTPTNATGDIGNYATLNPLATYTGATQVLSNGNLTTVTGTTSAGYSLATIAIPASGKYYFEAIASSTAGGLAMGVILYSLSMNAFTGTACSYYNDGTKFVNGVNSAYGSAYTTNLIGVAIDVDGGTITFYRDNVSQGAITYASAGLFPFVSDGSSTLSSTLDVNFGQRPFTYTPPTGFKALCTQNLPTPTIINGAQYMDATLYTGSASTQSVTNSGSMQPDLVWIKDRTSAQDNKLTDAVRGTTKGLISNTTGDETTDSNGVTAFNANGFSLGTGTRAYSDSNADSYVAWQWKESATSGFDIVTYTGNGSARTISHSLNAVPNMIIVKARTTASTDQGWPVYHSANTSAPETDYLMLNTTAATADLNTVWNDTAPTSSVFSVGTNANVNANNDTYVAYLWCAIAGYSAFGSYTGNGSTDGPFVYLGFRPKYVLIKRTDLANNWLIEDTSRDIYNAAAKDLYADLSQAEGTATSMDILSNGFKLRATGAFVNASTGTYIYAAFAESPFNYARAR